MALFARKKIQASGLDREMALGLRVIRSREIETDATDEGLTRIRYPAAVTPWVAGLAKRLRLWDGRALMRTLELDAMGTTVWAWIDDTRTVAALCEKLAARYQLHPREAEVAMTAFVRQLGRRGIVALG